MEELGSAAVHPAEFIKQQLDALGWNQRDLAFVLGVSEQSVNMLVTGKRGVSPKMAKDLEGAFGIPSDVFFGMQWDCDLANAREPSPDIIKRSRMQSKYPIREMIKRGWMQEGDALMLEDQLAKLFDVPDINHVPHLGPAAIRVAE